MSLVKIGVFAGVFDPMHLGHTYFIERAVQDNNLDKVYVLIERQPKYKTCIASYGQREEMAKLALKSIPKARVHKPKSNFFPITSTLPEIKKINPNAQIFLLLGEDVASHIGSWDDPTGALNRVGLIVAKREKTESFSNASSLKVREKIKNREKPELAPAVLNYIKKTGLYGAD